MGQFLVGKLPIPSYRLLHRAGSLGRPSLPSASDLGGRSTACHQEPSWSLGSRHRQERSSQLARGSSPG